MKLLALSTSTPRGSAALFDAATLDVAAAPLDAAAAPLNAASGERARRGGPAGAAATAAPGAGARLLAARSYIDLQGHAERIFDALDEVLALSGLPRAAIEALGCDVGPGSFTGVRVGVAAAKGVALALGIPAAGVTSLEAMAAAAFAEGAASAGDLLVPLIDAKKGEVFLAAFDDPAAPPRMAPRHVPRDAAADAVATLAAGRKLVVVGAVAEEIEALRPHRARGEALDHPDAVWIGRVAIRRLEAARAPAGARGELGREAGPFDPALLEPVYVRAPDAKPAELGYTPPR